MSDWRIVVSGVATDPETAYGFIIQQWPGAGMTSIQNISSDYGLLDGAIFQRQRAEVAALTLTGTINGSSVADLHTKRRSLINAVKPDRAASQQAVVLQYLGSGSTRQASAFFETGLTMNEADVYREKVSLRFTLFDPYWESTTSSSATLTVQTTFTANYIAQRAACGSWGTLATGFNGTVFAIDAGPNGTLVIGGSFTTADGNTANRVAQWNGTTLTNVGNGVNDYVTGVTVGRDNQIYVGGGFSTASGFTACSVANWTGTRWQTMASGLTGAGANASIGSLTVDKEGNIIVGGYFTRAGSVAEVNASGIAKWVVSSSSWTDIASGVKKLSGTLDVEEVAVAPNGDYWVVGDFDRAGSLTGHTACRVAFYSQSASAWVSPGSGISTSTNAKGSTLGIAPDGVAHIGLTKVSAGLPTTYYTSNGVSATPAASINDSVWKVFPVQNGNIVYMGGKFSTVNGVTMYGTARFVGNTATRMDILFPSNAEVQAVYSSSTGVTTFGFTKSGTASAAAVTTVTNNGTATTYPILTACAPTSGSTQLIQLVNTTTNEAIYFNLALNPSEIVTLDLTPGKKTFTSNFRGNIINTILPGSNVATWRLLPGANNVSFFLTGGSGAARLSWVERFWSAD